jgi:chorismate mutase/prephenate dehydratase
MEIEGIRKQIDELDDGLLQLFLERMTAAAEIAQYKKERQLAVLDKGREREILSRISKMAGPQQASAARVLFSQLFELSRSYQRRLMLTNTPFERHVNEALDRVQGDFPQAGVVACQGVEGAYSQLACDKLFSFADIVYLKDFEGVFNAVEQGLTEYGVLPIDNSTYSSITEVYDLMRDYQFHIARSIKLKVDHALLAPEGAQLSNITDIYSHEQAIGQCSEFLKKNSNIVVHECQNTAAAAEQVARLGRPSAAAISSRPCAGLYGLSIIADNFQNSQHNYTRFICITKDLRIYPGANRISLILTTPHAPGSLNALLSRFAVLGLNLTKLESRPIPGREFEFLFYFDFDASLKNTDVQSLLGELSSGEELFIFLGNYCEV